MRNAPTLIKSTFAGLSLSWKWRRSRTFPITHIPKTVTGSQQIINLWLNTGTQKKIKYQILKELLETNLRQRGIGNTNPIKLARCIKELERLNGIQNGGDRKSDGDNLNLKKQSDLAEDLGISQRQVADYKKLLTLIPELQDLVETGEMNATVGYKVWAKIPQEEQTRLVEELGKDKISNMTQQQTQEYLRQNW